MVDAVIGHQQFGLCNFCDFGQIGREGMDGTVVFLPLRCPLGKSAGVLDLVEQDIAAFAVLRNDRQRAGVAGNQNLLVGRLKKIGVAFQRAVADRQGGDRHQLVLIDDAGLYLGHIDLVSLGVGLLEAVDAEVDVHRIGLLDVFGHGADALRPEYL